MFETLPARGPVVGVGNGRKDKTSINNLAFINNAHVWNHIHITHNVGSSTFANFVTVLLAPNDIFNERFKYFN